jgi:hypothetical protein
MTRSHAVTDRQYRALAAIRFEIRRFIAFS